MQTSRIISLNSLSLPPHQLLLHLHAQQPTPPPSPASAPSFFLSTHSPIHLLFLLQASHQPSALLFSSPRTQPTLLIINHLIFISDHHHLHVHHQHHQSRDFFFIIISIIIFTLFIYFCV